MSMLDELKDARLHMSLADRSLYKLYCERFTDKFPFSEIQTIEYDDAEFIELQNAFLKAQKAYHQKFKEAIDYYVTRPDVVRKAVLELLDRHVNPSLF